MPEIKTSERPVDRVIAILQRQACNPQESGPGKWRARCPSHRGSSQNLSVMEGPDGKVVLHCFHKENGHFTCSFADIVVALGLTRKDMFPPTERTAKAPRKINLGKPHESPEEAIAAISKRLGSPTASWTYEEEDHLGQRFPLLIVYRFDPKDEKKQCRPVYPAPEGWYLGDPPGKLPLYNLPEIAKADLVVVVEGEKCADLVRQLGLVATTAAHGANGASKTDWRPLAGKKIMFIPDNDDPGEEYIDTGATLCHGLTPKPQIKMIRLPLTEKGDDIEQWICDVVPDTWDIRDCKLELLRLWHATGDWEPPAGSGMPAAVAVDDKTPPNLTEWGNARRLAAKFGKEIRYCYPKSQWMIWDERRWCPDTKGLIWHHAKQLSSMILEEAKDLYAEDRQRVLQWAMRSEQKRTLQSSIDLLWSEPGIGVMPDDFDTEPWLLNTPSGVIDLLTGEIRPQKPEDFLSKMTAVDYDPHQETPRWTQFLNTVFKNNEPLIAYLKRVLGYSLTGATTEHAMFLHQGGGRNGKNTLLEVLLGVMGEYGTMADPRIFLANGANDHPAGVADLVGMRLVVTSEPDEGQQLAEGLVKRLTGDKTVKARFMYGNWFEFRVQFKIHMLANHKPDVRGNDEGIWSRLKLIPYDVYLPGLGPVIKGFSEILIKEEGPGILAWLVDGCREWHSLTLGEPEIIAQAISVYRSEQDVIGDFLSECTDSFLDNPTLREQVRIATKDLYKAYTDWCESNGERAILTNKKFGREMTRRGYPDRPSNSMHYRYGLELKNPDMPPCDDSVAVRGEF